MPSIATRKPQIGPKAITANKVINGRGNITYEAGVYASTVSTGTHHARPTSRAQPVMRLPSRYWASGVNFHSAVKPTSNAVKAASLPHDGPERTFSGASL